MSLASWYILIQADQFLWIKLVTLTLADITPKITQSLLCHRFLSTERFKNPYPDPNLVNAIHRQWTINMSFIKGVILSEPLFKVFVFSFLVLIIAYA